MPFAASSEWINLTKRMCREFLRHEDAAQIGMSIELDPKQIVDFALHPVRPGPVTDGSWERGVRIVHANFDDDSFGRVKVEQHIMHFEARTRASRISEVVR